MIKLGLIGCGVVAAYGHLPAIKNVPELTLDAVFDPNAERAESAAREFGAAHWYTDSDAFFASGIEKTATTVCS